MEFRVPEAVRARLASGLPRHRAAAALYAALVCVCVPLFAPTGYYNLTDAKGILFLALTTVFGVLCAVLYAVSGRGLVKKASSPTAGALIAWVAVWCVSTLVNGVNAASVLGLKGRRNGLLMLCTCALCFVIVRTAAKSGAARRRIAAAAVGAGCAAALLGWMNFWLFDPFDFYYTVETGDGANFISTIGNINFFGSYLCLLAPAALWQNTKTQELRQRVLWSCAAVLLTSAFVPANSDGAWLGLAAGCALIVCHKRFDSHRLARLCAPFAGVFAVWGLCGVLLHILPARAELRTLSRVACLWPLCLAGAVLCAALAALLPRLPRVSLAFPMRLLTALACAACVLAAVAVNAFGISLGAADGLLRFSWAWGSNRGFVWSHLFDSFRWNFMLPQRLIGWGPEGVDRVINPVCTAQLIELNGSTFDSAHNEFLQQLVCGGVAGAAAWLAFWGACFVRALRRAPWLAGALAAYFVQSLFSISMAGVLPVAFVFCALADGSPVPKKNRKCRK